MKISSSRNPILIQSFKQLLLNFGADNLTVFLTMKNIANKVLFPYKVNNAKWSSRSLIARLLTPYITNLMFPVYCYTNTTKQCQTLQKLMGHQASSTH